MHEDRAEHRDPGVGLRAGVRDEPGDLPSLRVLCAVGLSLAGNGYLLVGLVPDDDRIASRRVAKAGHQLAVLARVRDLVGDQPPADEVVLVWRTEAGMAAVLKEHEHEHVDRDQRDREHGEAPRRDVVLERNQESGGRVAGRRWQGLLTACCLLPAPGFVQRDSSTGPMVRQPLNQTPSRTPRAPAPRTRPGASSAPPGGGRAWAAGTGPP